MSGASLAKLHAHYSHDWWTPVHWIDWAARTMRTTRSEMFDPCPCDWQEGDPSGLDIPWPCLPNHTNHPGARGAGVAWWHKYLLEQRRHHGRIPFVWCQFNVESIGRLPSGPLQQPGWLVWPETRTPFTWGGPTIKEKRDRKGKLVRAARVHGEPMRSPGNTAVWWTNMEPATPPVDCTIVRTC